MTAPAKTRRERTAQAARTAQALREPGIAPDTGPDDAPGVAPDVRPPAAAPARAPRRGARTGGGRTTAAERAYARRAQRVETLQRDAEFAAKRAQERRKVRWPSSRASFVLLMMGLLAAGVAATLWLSTQAIADSYRLEQLQQDNSSLAEQAQLLQRQVTQQESSSSLARQAKDLGMVPGGDPARIIVHPDGTTSLVGEPTRARAGAPSDAAAGDQPVPAGGGH